MFGYSDRIDSEKVNREIDKLRTLVARAYDKNREQAMEINSHKVAIRHLAGAFLGAAAGAGSFLEGEGFSFTPPSGQSNVLRVISKNFYEGQHSTTSLEYNSGSAILSTDGPQVNRVPLLTTGDLSEQVSISIGNGNIIDPTVKWMLEDDRFWCNRFSTSQLGIDSSATSAELDIHITLPPTIRPEINFFSISNIFPSGINHEIIWYDLHSNIHSISGFRNKFYPVQGDRFGSKITLKLTSFLHEMENNIKYFVFGLNQLKVGFRHYVPSGHVISKLDLTHTSGNDLTIHTFNASFRTPVQSESLKEMLRFRIADAVTSDESDLDGNILYDSADDPFPLQPSDTDILIQSAPNTLYVKTELKNNGSSPTVDGIYLEYSGA